MYVYMYFFFIPTHLSTLNSFLPTGKSISLFAEVLLWPSNRSLSGSAFKHPLGIFFQWPGTPVFALLPYTHPDSASLTVGDCPIGARVSEWLLSKNALKNLSSTSQSYKPKP